MDTTARTWTGDDMVQLILDSLMVRLLVYSEVKANDFGFNGLSPEILFYKCVNGLKHFMAKLKHQLNPTTLKYISAINL